MSSGPVVVGVDVGGTKTNATVVDDSGRILVDRMVEGPSRVTDGPPAAVDAIDAIMITVLAGNFLGDGLRSALDPKVKKA